MKILVVLMLAAFAACGGTSKPDTTPDHSTGTMTETQNETQGTGGTTYGGAGYGATDATPAGM